MEFLHTERLVLRTLEKSDAPVIHRYRNDSQCARYQRWDETSLPAMEQLVIDHEKDVFLSEAPQQRYGIALGDHLIGDLAYFYTEGDCVTLGITVAPAAQRKGYAFEILSAVLPAIQEKYPALETVALIDPENTASIRLFEKLGFVRDCYAESIRSLVYILK